MFRQALQSHLSKRLTATEYKVVCNVLRKYFCDPDFGFPPKPLPPRSVREIANLDVCDCVMPEIEEVECLEEQLEEQEVVCIYSSLVSFFNVDFIILIHFKNSLIFDDLIASGLSIKCVALLCTVQCT